MLWYACMSGISVKFNNMKGMIHSLTTTPTKLVKTKSTAIIFTRLFSILHNVLIRHTQIVYYKKRSVEIGQQPTTIYSSSR